MTEGDSARRTWLAALAGRRWEPLQVFALLAVLLFAATGPAMLGGSAHEVGDGAVNALAIRDAMDGVRIHGNYSRWGFFHPGPAFFYWQAGAEWLLCEFTQLAASPMAAHHFGMLMLQAALLALALAQCPSLARRAVFIPLACAVAAVHLACVNLYEPFGALLSTWPPHLLLAPFALFTLAAGRLGSGDLRALPWTILGGSLLVHGHAAHGLFVLPMFAIASALWAWGERRTPWRTPEDRRALILAGGILAVFLVPIAVDLAAGRDSNILAILHQLGAPSESRRTWYKAVLYVLSFYGYMSNQEQVIQTLSEATIAEFRRAALPLAAWALVHGFLAFTWFRRRADPEFRAIRAGITLVFAGIGLTLIWAKIQQGVLHNFNTFYIHGLMLAAAWLALGAALRRVSSSRRAVVIAAWTSLAVAALFTRGRFVRVLERMPDYRAEFEAAAERARKADPVLLSFPANEWPDIAGLFLAMKRAGVEARVGGEWAFMFGTRHVVDLGFTPRKVWNIRPVAAGSGEFTFLSRYGISTEVPRLEAPVEAFGAEGRPFEQLFVCGLVDGRDEKSPQAHGMTTDRIGWMRWRMPAVSHPVQVELDLNLRQRPGGDAPLRATVSTPRRTLAEVVVAGPTHLEFELRPDDFSSEGVVDVRIHVPDAWQPRALGASGDYRWFGLELTRMVVRRAE